MEELDLKELFELFMSKLFQIILIVIIMTGVGIVYTIAFTTPKYSASTSLVLTSASGNDTTANTITTTDVTLNSKLVSTYSEIVKSNDVIRQVISNLGINISEQELKRNVSVKEVEDAEMIKISVTNEDADVSAKIANEIAKVFCDTVADIYKINNLHILDQAEPNYTPANIHHSKDVIIFAFIGAVIAVMYVLLANMLDTTIKTSEDIEKNFGLPVLVSIPQIDNFSNDKGGKK